MKKKILVLFTLTLLIAGFNKVSALSTCEELSEADLEFYKSLNRPDIYDLTCSNGTPYTDEYLESINEISNIQNDNKENNTRYFVNKLNVPTFQQQPNYCGPASMKQAIHTVLGYSSSQNYYGTLVGTNTSNGTDQTLISGAMNSELGINKYTYVWTNSLTNAQYYNMVKHSIDLGYPPIMHIRMENMPIYNGHTGGHFVTISGHTITGIIGGDYSPISVYYVDPNNANYGNGATLGEHMVSLPTIKSAGYAGVLIYAA